MLLYIDACVCRSIWTGGETFEFTGEGDNVTLVCDVCMNPIGAYSWTFANGSLPPSTQNGNQLIIHSAELQHFGFYICQVENSVEELGVNFVETFPIELRLQGRPGKPENLTVEARTSVSMTLTWKCGHNGGDDNMWFEVTIYQEEAEIRKDTVRDTCEMAEIIDPPYRIHDLQDETAYKFEVIATNRFVDMDQTLEIATTQSSTSGHYPKISFTHLVPQYNFLGYTPVIVGLFSSNSKCYHNWTGINF